MPLVLLPRGASFGASSLAFSMSDEGAVKPVSDRASPVFLLPDVLNRLERIKEIDQILLLIRCETDAEAFVIEVHYIHQSGC